MDVSCQGILSVDKFKPVCHQAPDIHSIFTTGKEKQSEDCLYLNVWAPSDPNSTRMPVMVYVHGGGLQVGTANVDWY